MARTCELLIETGWTTVPIDALVKTGLVEIDPARVARTSEEIRLRPRQALQLGLILNELALGAGRGGVREGEAPVIAWRLEEGWMTLEWQERGGSSTGMARRIEALATRITALGGLGEIRDTAEGPLFALRLPLET
jgi:two-component sensor histidine kinase